METLETRFWKFVEKKDDNSCWRCRRAKVLGGYTQINLGNGLARVYCHRLSYELHHGKIPDGMFVDHICNVPDCVNPNHLRLCDSFDNARNTRVTSRSKSGVKGVQYRNGKWRARIRVNYILINLGTFDSQQSASDAYYAAAKLFFGEFANRGTR